MKHVCTYVHEGDHVIPICLSENHVRVSVFIGKSEFRLSNSRELQHCRDDLAWLDKEREKGDATFTVVDREGLNRLNHFVGGIQS